MKIIIFSIITAVLIVGVIIYFSNSRNSSDESLSQSENNVATVDGKQIITIKAKGGYLPKVTTAKANLPTIIKVETEGTFDCSSVLAIPSLDYRNNLPPSGETLIDIPPQKSGSTLRGLCAMGMYSFQIQFN